MKSTAEAFNALDPKNVKAGDIVQLAPGNYAGWQNYGRPLGIKGAPQNSVIVQSADTKNKAMILDMFLQSGIFGITFRDLTLDGSGGNRNPTCFQILNSENAGIDKCSVHGPLTEDPLTTLKKFTYGGIMLRGSKNVFVTNSEIQRFGGGIGNLDNDGVLIKTNHLHDIGTDFIDNGGSSNVMIDGNNIHNGWSSLSGAHPDGIQFWTSNTKTPVHDITIQNNHIWRDQGDQMQGIFMGNELKLRYRTVKIINNRVEGGIWHGISIFTAEDVLIQRNIVGIGPRFVNPRLPATSQVITANWIDCGDINAADGDLSRGLRLDNNWSDAYLMDHCYVTSDNQRHYNTPGLIGK